MNRLVITIFLAVGLLWGASANASLIDRLEIVEPPPAPFCLNTMGIDRLAPYFFSSRTVRFTRGRFFAGLRQKRSEKISWAKRLKRASRYFMGRMCYYERHSLD